MRNHESPIVGPDGSLLYEDNRSGQMSFDKVIIECFLFFVPFFLIRHELQFFIKK